MSVKTVKTDIENKSEKTESMFSKKQLLASERFKGRRDIINAVLSDNKKYTVSAVEQAVEKYMKGKVK